MGKKKFYTLKENRVIYAFLSPDRNCFYINSCRENTIRETYRHNMKGRRYFSENFISTIAPDRPCMFILEKCFITEAEAYRHIVAWVKVFLDKDYIPYNFEGTLMHACEMLDETLAIYNQIKSINIKELITCSNCVVKNYSKKLCDNFNIYSI